MENKEIKVFTAFSGYDSQCMALDKIGGGISYELVGWSEIDKYAIQAHNAVYPQYADRNFGDISQIDWKEVPDFDLFTYSFPCQDISNAGNQKGLEEGSGTRSSLLWECKKAIEAKRPKYLVMENVKALTSKKFLPFLEEWEKYLSGLGYTNSRAVLNAKNYGIPQNRERTFVVSIFGNDSYTFPKPFELQKRLRDILESNVDEKYYLSKRCIDGFNKHNENHKNKGTGFIFKPKDPDYDEYENCLRANAALCPTDNTIKVECLNTDKEGNAACIKSVYYKMGKANFLEHEKDGFKATCVKEYGNKRVQSIVESGKINPSKVTFIDAYNQATNEEVANTIKTTVDTSCMTFVTEPKFVGYTRDSKGNVISRHLQDTSNTIHQSTGSGGNTDCFVAEPQIGISVHPTGRKLEFKGESSINSEVSPCLRATDYKNPHCVWKKDVELDSDQEYRIRKLTPRECFRLMGVYEENIDKIQEAGISNSQQYKMAGNSIVVDVLYYIFKELFFGEKKVIKKEPTQLSLF